MKGIVFYFIILITFLLNVLSLKSKRSFMVESVNKEEVAEDGKYYRVQVGAYKTKQYAIDLAESLKKQGYPAIVKYY